MIWPSAKRSTCRCQVGPATSSKLIGTEADEVACLLWCGDQTVVLSAGCLVSIGERAQHRKLIKLAARRCSNAHSKHKWGKKRTSSNKSYVSGAGCSNEIKTVACKCQRHKCTQILQSRITAVLPAACLRICIPDQAYTSRHGCGQV